MLDSVFKVYDIRGIVHTDFFLDDVYAFGCAFITFCKQNCPDLHTIVLGRDGRVHSEKIYTELVRACSDMGVKVCNIGVCCTPVLYFALHANYTKNCAGIMITASHNGPEYNGLKLCLESRVVWGQDIQEIKKLARYCALEHKNRCHSTTSTCCVHEYNATHDYCEHIAARFSHLKNSDVPLVIDCANGAAATVLPQLIAKMGWSNVDLLYTQLDGTFPNHSADPTVYENMVHAGQKLLTLEHKTNKTGLALGFDGDCDRMGALCIRDGKPFLVPGDHLFALFVLKEKLSPVVCDIKFSQAVLNLFEKNSIDIILSPSGHSVIKQKMHDYGAVAAGELSCHFFFKDRYFGYDDGIYALFRLLELLSITKKSLTDLCESIPQSCIVPEMRIACAQEQKETLVNAVHTYFSQINTCEICTIDGVRVKAPYAIGLIRASHTQSVISLRFESETPEGLSRMQKEFCAILKQFLDERVLQKYF